MSVAGRDGGNGEVGRGGVERRGVDGRTAGEVRTVEEVSG